MIETMLIHLGHDVVMSVEGLDAVSAYKDAVDAGTPFALAVFDLTIPGGMGGVEAVKEILKIDPDARVVASSGYSNDPVMANCADFGFCAALTKPYRMQDLSQLISRIVG